jgi:hypothetical protein
MHLYRFNLYKAQRGEPVQVCYFTEDEKRSFDRSQLKLDEHIKQDLQQE